MMRLQASLVQAALLLAGLSGCSKLSGSDDKQKRPPAPVAVAPIEWGTIEAFRTFSGSLEASASFIVSSKIGGRVEAVLVDIGDPVLQGGVVARIDDGEYRQATQGARADLLVAQANLAEAKSALEIVNRSIDRAKALRERGVTSEAELDSARSDLLAKQARVKVFEAQVTRAEATLKTTQIQLNYADVTAKWAGPAKERVVAERFVDDGAIVSANTPLVRVVELAPISAVFFVPEKDYASLQIGQAVTLNTDAFPGQSDIGVIERIAPVFQNSSRQARVEVTVENADKRLKPGMFVRANVQVDQAEAAAIVPADAIVKRSDTQGVFVVLPDGKTAKWCPVTVGIRHGNRVEVRGEGLQGNVITLGQQLVEDGAPVILSQTDALPPGESPRP